MAPAPSLDIYDSYSGGGPYRSANAVVRGDLGTRCASDCSDAIRKLVTAKVAKVNFRFSQ